MAEPQHWRELPNAPLPGTPLCTASEVGDGECRLIALGEAAQRFELIVLRSGDAWRAYANRCPHFGVGLARQQQHLLFQPHQSLSCNVHYSRFRWEDGICDRGECVGEGLLAIPVEAVAGILRIAG